MRRLLSSFIRPSSLRLFTSTCPLFNPTNNNNNNNKVDNNKINNNNNNNKIDNTNNTKINHSHMTSTTLPLPTDGPSPFGRGVGRAALQSRVDGVAGGAYGERRPRALMFVNRRPVEILPGEENLLEVLEREGVRVPKFCYHPILSVAGNCRMCMVQVDGTGTVIVACATVAMPGMSIITDSRLVRDAREGNVELILINHPNDCPICEQATNCDLQNVSMNYGTGIPRYKEDKKAVEDFYFDPQTRVVLNRCIHCTRCVRFLNEHAQDFNLGQIGRGGLSEISTFLDELEVKTDNNMPVSQLCPVGNLCLAEADENNQIVEELERKKAHA